MNKPIVGIVAKHLKQSTKRLDTVIHDEVEQAIFDNGGIVIGIIPPNEGKVRAEDKWYDNLTTTEKHNLYDQIALCDGIILQGGSYMDEYECFIAKYCYEQDIPVLGICAGKHVLVRAIGGNIGPVGNMSHKSEERYVHSIEIDENSKFYKIINNKEIMVNSRHVNMTTSTPLFASAHSSDGVIEVEEAPNKRFYLGVQFHPESLYKQDENMRKIFIGFLDACLEYKEGLNKEEN